ncbi:MAG: DegT/DnrJ/EryC1/StrS family aminotransferase [Bryobacteraceae bacterium]|jgi:dTDP-4-amino-4,6-dideoxygalactose transaminase
MTRTTAIPFLDLVTVHEELREELVSVFGAALETGAFVGGPMVEEFERDFAKYCGTQHCVGVGSGTDALRFALVAAGIEQGDIVITVPNTFIATTETISQAGARPAFVDVDARTYNMDPEKLRQYLESECTIDDRGRPIDRATGSRVTAVVPVHLYGQMCDMDAILEVAELFNLAVIEDACQAHGAEYFSAKENRWRTAGSMGRAAAFSFYPGKNLGACGEAGAITTNDGDLARRARMLRDHGQARKYYHDTEGYNGRLDAIQAGILRVKLRHLTKWNAGRRRAAARYRDLFAEAQASEFPPFEPDWAKSIYHLFVIRVPYRDVLIRQLADANIGTGIHYPVPLHLQKAYECLGHEAGDYPVAESLAPEILSLPMFPQLEYAQQVRVVKTIQEFAAEITPAEHSFKYAGGAV